LKPTSVILPRAIGAPTARRSVVPVVAFSMKAMRRPSSRMMPVSV
jgi:hypothetical protein